MTASTAPIVSAVVVGLLISGACLRMDGLANQSFQAERRAQVAERTDVLRATLEQSIDAHLRVLTSAQAVILARPVLDQSQVRRIGPTLVLDTPAVRSIMFSPVGAATLAYASRAHVAPSSAAALEATGAACATRDEWPGAVAMLDALPGQPGMFALAPVFLTDSDGARRFWGCVSVVLDYAALLKPAASLFNDEAVTISLQGHRAAGVPQPLAGAPSLDARAVAGSIRFAGGEWKALAQPGGGWDQPRPYSTPLRLLMIFCTLVGAGAAFMLHTRGIRNRQLLAQLKAGEQARRQWVADTSHELRTPITILSTRLDALRDGMIALTTDELDVLSDTVEGMERLVTDLHQLARSDASALAFEFEDVDLAELIDDAWQGFTLRFAQHPLAMRFEGITPGMTVRADALRLTQVLTNLWTNTLRYTDSGGSARLTVSQGQGMVTLRFDDSAPGVPDDALPRLFERFFRGDSSRSRASGGSGLGLSICQAILEAHGGSMQASHSTLGGVCMTLKLPQGAHR